VIISVNQVAVRMRECSSETPLAANDRGGLHISSNQCLSPEVFSASISFSPAEFPSMSVSAAAAGSFPLGFVLRAL